MSRNIKAEGEGAEVGDFAEKFDGRFGVAVFELAIGGTHAAEGLNPAVVTDGLAGALGGADFAHATEPAFAETVFAEVVAILTGKDADAHAAGGIDGASVLAATAGVALGV